MMKMIVITTIPVTLEVFLRPFARHFREHGWHVDAMARGVNESSASHGTFDAVHDVDWSRNPFDLRNLLRAAPRVRAVVEQGGYDIVHVHTPVAAFVTRFALRKLRRTRSIRVIYTAHGFHFYEGAPRLQNALYLALEKMAGRWADYIVVINHEDEAAARRHQIVPPERVRYMPGIGVDTSQYTPDAVPENAVQRVRAEIGLASSDRLLLMIAEFNPGKRHADALEAFARIDRPNVHLAFAGTGLLFNEMQARSAALGVQERVHFLGYRTDIPVLLRAADASLLPSEREGLPRSVMESMGLGTPVIGTDIRGMRDLLGDGAGYLVPVGDPVRLAEAMRRIIDHPEEARAVGDLARERIKAFDLQKVIALHETLYAEALCETGSAPGFPT